MTVDEVEMDQIGKATIADQPALTETLAQAFQTDPALSWILPDPAHRTRALRGLFRTLVPADMRSGLALRSVNDEAAALRSEERRVGKECASTCRIGWSPYN